MSTAWGDAERAGEMGFDIVRKRGGEFAGDDMSAHAALASGKNPPAVGAQELLLDGCPSLPSKSGVEAVIGLAVDEVDGALAITERGCKMVKI